MSKRKVYSADFKAKLVLEVLEGDKTIILLTLSIR